MALPKTVFSEHRYISDLVIPCVPLRRGQHNITEGQLNWESEAVVIVVSDCRLWVLSFYLASVNPMVVPS